MEFDNLEDRRRERGLVHLPVLERREQRRSASLESKHVKKSLAVRSYEI